MPDRPDVEAIEARTPTHAALVPGEGTVVRFVPLSVAERNALTAYVRELEAKLRQACRAEEAERDRADAGWTEATALRADNERLRREWPERNQVEGLGRALAILQDLRATLRLTSIGRSPAYGLGREPSYEAILRHHIDAIETMIGPDYTRASHTLTWAKALHPQE